MSYLWVIVRFWKDLSPWAPYEVWQTEHPGRKHLQHQRKKNNNIDTLSPVNFSSCFSCRVFIHSKSALLQGLLLKAGTDKLKPFLYRYTQFLDFQYREFKKKSQCRKLRTYMYSTSLITADARGKFYMSADKPQIDETRKSVAWLHVTAWIFGECIFNSCVPDRVKRP